jgi:hypothetical protein
MRLASSDLPPSPQHLDRFRGYRRKARHSPDPCRGWHRYNARELQHPVSEPVEGKDGDGRAIANLGFLLYGVEEGVLGDRKKQ